MAFNKISHPTLAAALSLLQPGSFVPTRQQLATSLLDSCYEDYRLRMAHELSGQPCTLTTDAWTDVTGKAVLNYVAICGEKTFFLESVYTGAVSHDATFLASDIERVIHDYSWLTVSAVVTDNTPTNKLDLVAKLKWLNKLESDCRTVVRFLKKSQQLWYELRRLQKAEGKSALVLPADTRWGTIEKCFSSMLGSEELLFTFVSSWDFLKAKTKDLKAKRRFAYSTITARDFVKNLEKAVKILSVLSNFQKAFKRNTTPVSDAYDMFLQLRKLFEDIQMPFTEYSSIVRVIQDRFNFVYGDAHARALAAAAHAPRRGDHHPLLSGFFLAIALAGYTVGCQLSGNILYSIVSTSDPLDVAPLGFTADRGAVVKVYLFMEMHISIAFSTLMMPPFYMAERLILGMHKGPEIEGFNTDRDLANVDHDMEIHKKQSYIQSRALGEVNNLMSQLRRTNNAAELSKDTALHALKRNATRWSSTFEMLHRYVRIRAEICKADAVEDLVPTGATHRNLVELLDHMKRFESVT
ncbi:Amino Acid/Auxin Permease (AAAP) Family [Phytophthora cinnamomi]|uniref:Amino Acid/Auxin Permease (AAAP) Family n=1 Tax=Phytophthora cinnamomi TaxID=4785 RepID=UPI00355AA126|nr:Amino Acid/Auxin Permease (AAAP) Family [Phytophthora cinnamomi]